jgi:hypothetical protein
VGREEGAGAVGVSSSSAILCSDSKYRSTASFCAFISSLISRCTCRSFGESWGHGGGGGGGGRGSRKRTVVRGVGPAHEGLNVVRLNLVAFPKVTNTFPKDAVLLNQHSLQITDHLQTPCGGARGRRRAEAEREAERVEKEGEQHGVREVGVREIQARGNKTRTGTADFEFALHDVGAASTTTSSAAAVRPHCCTAVTAASQSPAGQCGNAHSMGAPKSACTRVSRSDHCGVSCHTVPRPGTLATTRMPRAVGCEVARPARRSVPQARARHEAGAVLPSR